jgi:hypothetical protein
MSVGSAWHWCNQCLRKEVIYNSCTKKFHCNKCGFVYNSLEELKND